MELFGKFRGALELLCTLEVLEILEFLFQRLTDDQVDDLHGVFLGRDGKPCFELRGNFFVVEIINCSKAAN